MIVVPKPRPKLTPHSPKQGGVNERRYYRVEGESCENHGNNRPRRLLRRHRVGRVCWNGRSFCQQDRAAHRRLGTSILPPNQKPSADQSVSRFERKLWQTLIANFTTCNVRLRRQSIQCGMRNGRRFKSHRPACRCAYPCQRDYGRKHPC